MQIERKGVYVSECLCVCVSWLRIMFFVVWLNNSFNFPLGWIKYIVVMCFTVHPWRSHCQDLWFLLEPQWTLGHLLCVWRQHHASVADGRWLVLHHSNSKERVVMSQYFECWTSVHLFWKHLDLRHLQASVFHQLVEFQQLSGGRDH